MLAQAVNVVRGEQSGNLQQLIGEDEPSDVHGIKTGKSDFVNWTFLKEPLAFSYMTVPSVLMTANPKFAPEIIILYLSPSPPPNSRSISGVVSGKYGTSKRFASASEI